MYMGPKFFILPLRPRGEDASTILLQIQIAEPVERKLHGRGELSVAP